MKNGNMYCKHQEKKERKEKEKFMAYLNRIHSK